MSEERKKADLRRADWEQRLEILRLRNQGWKFKDIGNHLGISKQAVHQAWTKIKDMSVEQAEEYAELFAN